MLTTDMQMRLDSDEYEPAVYRPTEAADRIVVLERALETARAAYRRASERLTQLERKVAKEHRRLPPLQEEQVIAMVRVVMAAESYVAACAECRETRMSERAKELSRAGLSIPKPVRNRYVAEDRLVAAVEQYRASRVAEGAE